MLNIRLRPLSDSRRHRSLRRLAWLRCLLAGAIAMPPVCFLAAWKQPLRHLFFIPVTLLLRDVLLMLYFSVRP